MESISKEKKQESKYPHNPLISLPFAMIKDTNLSKSDVANYCYLYAHLYRICGDNGIVYVDQLLYQKLQTIDHTNYQKKEFSKSIEKLMDLGYITGKKLKSNIYLLDRIDYPEAQHLKVKFYSIQQITSGSTDTMLYHYLFILMSRDWMAGKGKAGHRTINYLAMKENLDVSTILRMNAFLESEKLLYIFHSKYNADVCNTYCLPEDKEFAEEYLKTTGIFTKYVENSPNYKKSMLQKIRWYNEGKSYDDEEVEIINNFIRGYNRDLDKLYAKTGDPKHIQKQKPLIINEKGGKTA